MSQYPRVIKCYQCGGEMWAPIFVSDEEPRPCGRCPKPENPELELILEEYMLDFDDPGQHAALCAMIERYPAYRDELTDFAVFWARMEHLPHPPDNPEATKEMIRRALERLKELTQ